MSSPVSVALVGIAGFGESYIKTFLSDPNARQISFLAAADPAPERCRLLPELKARNVNIFPSLEALLKSEQPELLILCTPIHLHAQQTRLSVDHRIPVLCEKPLAGGLADALEMIQAQNDSGLMVAIGYQWSFSRAIQALKKAVLAGDFGAPRRLRTMVSFPRARSYFTRNSWAGKIKTPDGRDVLDSPVNNATAHYLHNMLYLLGERWNTSITPRTVQAELYRANAIENYDNAAVRCTTASGVEILFYTAHSMPKNTGPKFVFEFERATVTFDPIEARSPIVATLASGERREFGSPDAYRPDKIWQCAAAVRSGQEIACPAHAALPHTLCALAAQRSMPGIIDFPERLLREHTLETGTMVAVDGLAETLQASFDRGVLPSELGGVEWASAGSVVDVEMPNVG